MEEKPNIWKQGLNSGLIIGLILIVYSLLLFILGLNENMFLTWASFLILIGGIVWSHQQYKKNGDGFMKYSQGLGLGMLVAGVSGLLNSIFSVVYIRFIDPAIMARMEQAMEEQRVAMEDQGMSAEQVEQAMQIAAFFQTPLMMFVMGALSFIFIGLLFSLIISAFTKNEQAPA